MALKRISDYTDAGTLDGTESVELETAAGSSVKTTTQDIADLASSSGMSNPMTTAGDIIVGGAAGAAARLAVGGENTVLHGGTTPAYSSISEADLTLADNTTANVSTTKHGFVPKAPNDATKYLDGTGVYSTPAGSGSGDMESSTYDAAGVDEQLVGLTAAQTLTHKDLSDSTNTFPVALQAQHRGINDQTGTSYTLALTDAGKDVRCNNASAITITVPPNSSVAFPVGTMIAFSQKGAGAVTATAGSGVTVNAANGAATIAQYDARVLEKVDTDTWRVW